MTVRPDETPEPKPLVLDGVTFTPQPGDVEIATRGGTPIGEISIEESRGANDERVNTWRARKGVGDWRPMRCRAEARAFLVSVIRL